MNLNAELTARVARLEERNAELADLADSHRIAREITQEFYADLYDDHARLTRHNARLREKQGIYAAAARTIAHQLGEAEQRIAELERANHGLQLALHESDEELELARACCGGECCGEDVVHIDLAGEDAEEYTAIVVYLPEVAA